MGAIHVTGENFGKAVLEATMPVLVDFWAGWCGPCKMLGPIVDMVADEQNAVRVCKVDVDAEMEIASKYGVMSIPTLILFKNGEEVKRSVGVISKDEMMDFINS